MILACKVPTMMAFGTNTPAIVCHNCVFYWAVYTKTNKYVNKCAL